MASNHVKAIKLLALAYGFLSLLVYSHPNIINVEAPFSAIDSLNATSLNIDTLNNGEDNKVIILQADEWCPYNCGTNAKNQGYLVDIAKAVFEPKGYIIDYQVTNWSRAIYNAKNGHIHGVLGALHGDAPGFIFPNKPLGITINSLWVKPSNKLKYINISSLNNFRIGVIQDYSYGEAIDQYINKVKADDNKLQKISGVNPLERNVKLVLKTRIDGTIEDSFVMQHYLFSNKTPDALTMAAQISEDDVFIAFSPNVPNSAKLAALLNEGLSRLRASGQLTKILAKYGLKDWQ